jgi:hypothetical protein
MVDTAMSCAARGVFEVRWLNNRTFHALIYLHYTIVGGYDYALPSSPAKNNDEKE